MDLLSIRVGERSIHSRESLAFMEKCSPAPEVLAIMKHGLKLPFTREPPPYYEENNKSCMDNIQVARKKVKQWTKEGFVTEVGSKPFVCSPLTVARRTDYLTGEEKFRPCLDLSRHINPLLAVPNIKLEDISVSEKLLEQNDFQASWDLVNCYFHVVIHPEHRKYLGFSLQDEHGKTRFYHFNVMIYGVAIAAFVVTTLTKPIMSHLHKRGVRSTIFIDDGKVVAATAKQTWSHLKYALSVFEAAGWNIQHAKTSTAPVQKIYHMGYWCDSVTMSYSISEVKMKHIEDQISQILCASTWKLKDLSRVAGKCMAVIKAIGPVVSIMLRSAFIFIAENLNPVEQNYNVSVSPCPRVVRDLRFLKENLRTYEGQPIFINSVGYCLNKAIEDGDIAKAESELSDIEQLWVSDSSEIKAVAYNLHNIGDEIAIHNFTTTEKQLSSSARELIAVEVALERLSEKIHQAGVSNIYWVTDSQVLTIWLQKWKKYI